MRGLEAAVSAEPIRKEATGRYVVVVDVAAPGERRKQLKRRFATYREARVWLGTTRSQVGAGSFVRPQRMTLAQWVDEWLPVLRTQVRRQTYDSYERNLRLHVLPTLGARPLQSIKAAELTTLYARLLVSGRVDHRGGEGLSGRSVAYLATILGKCLEAAVRGDLIASNPARRAEVPKASAAATRHEQMRTWTQQQLAHFLQVTRGHQHWVAWLLLATTGLRRGEALGLAWSSVDLEAGRMSVSRTLVDLDGDEPVWSDPKTARGRRSIALDPSTVAALRTVRVAQAQQRLLVGAGYVDHNLVFARPDGRPWHPERFSRTFGEQVARHGLPALSVHGLRHSWATLALGSGVHPKVVQERLGHSTIGITLDVYSHVMPSMETDAADRVAALILGSPL
jgi:integrase